MKPEIKSAHILLVDDEPANLKLLQKILQGEGFIHLTAISDPRLVVSTYQQQRVDLILLDLNMPHLDGFAVMEQLFALNQPLLAPIVMLTAQAQHDIMLKALTLGARDFITKPFHRVELLARVRNLLEAHLAHRFLEQRKAVLEEMVAERTQELNRSHQKIVRLLAKAAEFRDNETGAHVLRMSYTASMLAKRLGWDEKQCELLFYASPMHDVGKIGISDTILLKPGRLTPEERFIMEQHAEIGARILEEHHDNELLQMAYRIALSHHEKWDGTGYPRGLKGEEIPIEGRIAAIADVFDALTSTRPYKRAWPIEDAVNFLKEQSGKHFDPNLVAHFLAILPEVLVIRQRYADEDSEDAALSVHA